MAEAESSESHNGVPLSMLEPKPSSDPNDPLNWPRWRKYLNFTLISYYSLMVFALIDIASVTWGQLNAEMGFSFSLLNDAFAAGNGSMCISGFILVPFALKFGRRPIYIFSTVFQIGMCVWYAKVKNEADLILVSLLSCGVGALAEVMVQMTVADMFFFHERGLMNAIYYWFMITGAVLSPLPGGFITSSQGWRWVWWWLAILLGAGLIVFIFFYEETMFLRKPVESRPSTDESENNITITPEKTDEEAPAKSSHSTGPVIDHSIPEKKYRDKLALWSNSPMSLRELWKHSYQPFIVMFRVPAAFFISLEYGVLITCIVLPVTSLSSYMTLPPYNFNSTQIGLMSLAPFIGSSVGVIIGGYLSDYTALYLARRNNGTFEPEMRLWACFVFAPFIPAGLIMFGVGLNNGSHWLLPAFGLGITSFGVLPASSAALTYLTDAHTHIISDCMLVVTFIRNAILTMFIFALQPWTDSVGLTWVYVTFALITSLILLLNVIFIWFGKSFRFKSAEKHGY